MSDKKGLIELGWFGELPPEDPPLPPGVIAAHQAADREDWMMHDPLGHQIGWVRDLYVRAFLAGAQWREEKYEADKRAEDEKAFGARPVSGGGVNDRISAESPTRQLPADEEGTKRKDGVR